MNTTNVSDIAGKNEHNKNVLDIPVKSKHNTQNVSWHPPLSVDSSVGLDLVFIRSGPFLSDPAFLSDPGLFFAEIRAPLVAVITNSGERAKSTTENKSQVNLTFNWNHQRTIFYFQETSSSSFQERS